MTDKETLLAYRLREARETLTDANMLLEGADSAKKFFDAINNPPAPNEKLLAAFRSHRELL